NDPQNQWIFCPSIPGAIAGLALFSIITLAHFVQAFMYRKRFCWVICMATSWEIASFVFRVLGARDPRNELYNTGSQILVILAPLWVNAFAYMVMGRMVYYWLPSKSVWNIKARKLTKIFVWFDVFTFLVQLGGGGMLSSDDASSVSLGMKIYMAGIGIQQACLLLFVILIIRFHRDVRKVGLARPTSWKPQLYTLYVVLTLISIRIIFRLVEFSSGIEGYIPSHEGFFYALEATPMILATGAFAIIHPGRSLTGPESEFTK
ncbi:RTA1 domain-containing protein, partial [Hyaloscypha variabilis F]